MDIKHYEWNKIAFKLPSELKNSKFVFISGSREMSFERILDLFKENIKIGDIVWGIYEEDYIDGFDGQVQFKTLDKKILKILEEKLSKAILPRKLSFLNYSQKDSIYLFDKLKPIKTIFVNASWKNVFHRTDVFYKLHEKNIKYDLVSPFVSESEAKEYLKKLTPKLNELSNLTNKGGSKLNDKEIFELADKVSNRSFDHTFQVGAVLVKKGIPLLVGWNKCLPFETYPMHFGSLREKNFSPPGDLNNYDTLHSEIDILIEAGKKKIDLKGTSLYINLLPCPTCAKAVSQSDIETIYYKLDHSEGYAYKLLTSLGKKCIRV